MREVRVHCSHVEGVGVVDIEEHHGHAVREGSVQLHHAPGPLQHARRARRDTRAHSCFAQNCDARNPTVSFKRNIWAGVVGCGTEGMCVLSVCAFGGSGVDERAATRDGVGFRALASAM